MALAWRLKPNLTGIQRGYDRSLFILEPQHRARFPCLSLRRRETTLALSFDCCITFPFTNILVAAVGAGVGERQKTQIWAKHIGAFATRQYEFRVHSTSCPRRFPLSFFLVSYVISFSSITLGHYRLQRQTLSCRIFTYLFFLGGTFIFLVWITQGRWQDPSPSRG